MTKTRIAAIALLAVGFGWGAAFVLMKDAIEQQQLFDFLATRFSLAAILMAVLQPKRLRNITPQDLKLGAVLGTLLAAGYITQTIGLELTTAAISGFITGLYVVLTPILAWFVIRKRPEKKLALAVIVALVGLALITGATGSNIQLQTGQLWLLACAVIFAMHIFWLGQWGHGRDPYTFSMIQIGAVGAISWVFALSDGYQAPPNAEVWFAIAFTAIISTVAAFWIQTWAQTVLDSSRVALLLTSEVVFAAAISVAVGQEVLGVTTLIGGSLMVVAMLIIEWPGKTQTLSVAAP